MGRFPAMDVFGAGPQVVPRMPMISPRHTPRMRRVGMGRVSKPVNTLSDGQAILTKTAAIGPTPPATGRTPRKRTARPPITARTSRTDSDAGGFVPAPTPPPMKCKPGEMTAKHCVKFLTYKVCDNLSALGRAFRHYDSDGSGEIDYDEFRNFIEQRYNLFLNKHEFHNMMKEVDPDRSGEIDYAEFIGFFQNKYQEEFNSDVSWQVARELRNRVKQGWKNVSDAFLDIDKDRNGQIDKEEMREVLQQWIPDLTNQKLDDLWNKLDTDDNGTLCYAEFAEALQPQCAALKLKPMERPEDARPDGLDPFLVSGDPGAAGLLPGISQSLVAGTLNRLRTDPLLAAVAKKDGLIRAIPDRALFNQAKLAPPTARADEFTSRPFLEPHTLQMVRQRQTGQPVPRGQGAIGYLTQRGQRGCVPHFANAANGTSHFTPKVTPRGTPRGTPFGTPFGTPRTARSGRSVLNLGSN